MANISVPYSKSNRTEVFMSGPPSSGKRDSLQQPMPTGTSTQAVSPPAKKRRSLLSSDSYRLEIDKQFSSLFDYVMVFPMDKVETGEATSFPIDFRGTKKTVQYRQSAVAKNCIHTMLEQGLELYPYESVQGDELIVLIKCPV